MPPATYPLNGWGDDRDRSVPQPVEIEAEGVAAVVTKEDAIGI